jgi:hypothetical protein
VGWLRVGNGRVGGWAAALVLVLSSAAAAAAAASTIILHVCHACTQS